MNSVRGRSRNSLAIRTSGASSGSIWAEGGADPANIWVIAKSSWSNRERLGIGTPHAVAELFQGAELQLLDRAFTSA